MSPAGVLSAHGEAVFVLLLVVATAVAIAVRRWRIPYTVALVPAGLALGWVHAFQAPALSKELLFSMFLPGLVFEAAFHIEFRQFWQNRLAIVSMAVPGVVAATALTALILTPAAGGLHFAEGFNWHYALVFGALISAQHPERLAGLQHPLSLPLTDDQREHQVEVELG